jgi:hypothetical protein
MTPAIRPMAAGTASQRLAGKRGPLSGPWLITSNRHPRHRTDSGASVQLSRDSRSQAKKAALGFVVALHGLPTGSRAGEGHNLCRPCLQVSYGRSTG